jgi:hypothetical protein
MFDEFEPQQFPLQDGSAILFGFDNRFQNMAVRDPEDGHVLFGSHEPEHFAAAMAIADPGCFSELPEVNGTVWSVVDVHLAHGHELLLNLWMPDFDGPYFGCQLGEIRVSGKSRGYSVSIRNGETISCPFSDALLPMLLAQMKQMENGVPAIFADAGQELPPPFTAGERQELRRVSTGPDSLGARLGDGEHRFDELMAVAG